MLFLMPNKQCQSTEGKVLRGTKRELQINVNIAMLMLLAGLKLKLQGVPKQTKTKIWQRMMGMLVSKLIVQRT